MDFFVSISEQSGEVLGQKSKDKNAITAETQLTAKQQQKQDALELAEIIYDIFQDSLSSATISPVSTKDKNNA